MEPAVGHASVGWISRKLGGGWDLLRCSNEVRRDSGVGCVCRLAEVDVVERNFFLANFPAFCNILDLRGISSINAGISWMSLRCAGDPWRTESAGEISGSSRNALGGGFFPERRKLPSNEVVFCFEIHWSVGWSLIVLEGSRHFFILAYVLLPSRKDVRMFGWWRAGSGRSLGAGESKSFAFSSIFWLFFKMTIKIYLSSFCLGDESAWSSCWSIFVHAWIYSCKRLVLKWNNEIMSSILNIM